MTEATVAFVDLAGFVALTEAHGASAAADLADRFLELATATMTESARVVKTIGDAVMIAAAEPGHGLGAAVALILACHAEPGFPLARGGIEHGSVEARGDDLFGPAVNLAARLTAYAAGPQLLITDAILPAAHAAGHAPAPIGDLRLRNITHPVPAYAITIGADPATVIDPVCRMRLEPCVAAGWLHHAGEEYYFCSRECLAAFATDPATYT